MTEQQRAQRNAQWFSQLQRELANMEIYPYFTESNNRREPSMADSTQSLTASATRGLRV